MFEGKTLEEMVQLLVDGNIEDDYASVLYGRIYTTVFDTKNFILLPHVAESITSAILSKVQGYLIQDVEHKKGALVYPGFILLMMGAGSHFIDMLESSLVKDKRAIYTAISQLLRGSSEYRRIAAIKVPKLYFDVQVGAGVHWLDIYYPSENYKSLKQFLDDYFPPIKARGDLTGYTKYDFCRDLRKGTFYQITLDQASVDMINEDMKTDSNVKSTIATFLIDQLVLRDLNALMSLNIDIDIGQIHFSKESIEQFTTAGFDKLLKYYSDRGLHMKSSYYDSLRPEIITSELFKEHKNMLSNSNGFMSFALEKMKSKQLISLLS